MPQNNTPYRTKEELKRFANSINIKVRSSLAGLDKFLENNNRTLNLGKFELNDEDLETLLGYLSPDVFKNIERIDLQHSNSENKLTKLPTSLQKFENLKSLNASSHRITRLPNWIGNLQNLGQLELAGNKITELPLTFGNLKNLHTLNLMRNEISELPQTFGNLQNLRVINLMGNSIRELPQTFGNLQNLENIELSRNKFENFPEVLTELLNTEKLDLANNNISTIPDSIRRLSNLQNLDLSHNDISELPDLVDENNVGLTNLMRISLANNNLSALPESFGKLISLLDCILDSNNLKSLPESFGNLASLSELSLRGNVFTQLSDDTFKNCVNLETIDFESNGFKSIPKCLALLPKLKWLSLSNNRITNISPEELKGKFKALVNLSLSHNNIDTLIVELFKLPKLNNIDLDSNKIERFPLNLIIEQLNSESLKLNLSSNQIEYDLLIKNIHKILTEDQRNNLDLSIEKSPPPNCYLNPNLVFDILFDENVEEVRAKLEVLKDIEIVVKEVTDPSDPQKMIVTESTTGYEIVNEFMSKIPLNKVNTTTKLYKEMALLILNDILNDQDEGHKKTKLQQLRQCLGNCASPVRNHLTQKLLSYTPENENEEKEIDSILKRDALELFIQRQLQLTGNENIEYVGAFANAVFQKGANRKRNNPVKINTGNLHYLPSKSDNFDYGFEIINDYSAERHEQFARMVCLQNADDRTLVTDDKGNYILDPYKLEAMKEEYLQTFTGKAPKWKKLCEDYKSQIYEQIGALDLINLLTEPIFMDALETTSLRAKMLKATEQQGELSDSEMKRIYDEHLTEEIEYLKVKSVKVRLDVAKKRIVKAAESNTSKLDLSGLGLDSEQLKELVPIINQQLPHIDTLDLSFNNFNEIPAEIGLLTQVEDLNFSACYISSFPDNILDKLELKRLDISLNDQLNVLPFNKEPTCLNYLNYSNTGINPNDYLLLGTSGLAVEHSDFQMLLKFNLVKDKINIAGREHHTVLDLSGLKLNDNEVLELKPLFDDLKFYIEHYRIHSINISDNQMSTIPNFLFTSIPNLVTLDAKKNPIETLPLELTPDQLSHLEIDENNLSKETSARLGMVRTNTSQHGNPHLPGRKSFLKRFGMPSLSLSSCLKPPDVIGEEPPSLRRGLNSSRQHTGSHSRR